LESFDPDLIQFETAGATPLPSTEQQGHVENDGARIWYASFGDGFPLILLHGGLGHSGNWGYQVPGFVRSGYRVVVIDSRGHGRSTRDEKPYSYELMATDVLAVMDSLQLDRATFIGWSDGACTALILADQAPERVAGVFFFACNMDPSGTKEFVMTPIVERCFSRHTKDYSELSATPDRFKEFVDAVSLMMSTQPNYSAKDLAAIQVPVSVVLGEHDEFIRREHLEYLACTIPQAELLILQDVSHFAPLQRPDEFTSEVLKFMRKLQV